MFLPSGNMDFYMFVFILACRRWCKSAVITSVSRRPIYNCDYLWCHCVCVRACVRRLHYRECLDRSHENLPKAWRAIPCFQHLFIVKIYLMRPPWRSLLSWWSHRPFQSPSFLPISVKCHPFPPCLYAEVLCVRYGVYWTVLSVAPALVEKATILLPYANVTNVLEERLSALPMLVADLG